MLRSIKCKQIFYDLVNVIIGQGDAVNGSFDTIKWGENRYFLKMEMDTDGGADFKDMGASQLYSVPYALYAEQAGNLVETKEQQATSFHQSPQKRPSSYGGNRTGIQVTV